MTRDTEIEKFRKENAELRKTITVLRDTIQTFNELTITTRINPPTNIVEPKQNQYQIFPNQENVLEYDASWSRLVTLLNGINSGLTASELALRWGKSRSRTSEVLNKLVQEGYLMKIRDGRTIRFRSAEE